MPLARATLLVGLLSVSFVDYQNLRQTAITFPDAWMDVIRGTADAPQQYRVAVPWAGYWMAQHLHLPMRYGFALVDAVSLIVTAMLLLQVLAGSAVYRESRRALQWLGAAALVALVEFYVAWAFYMGRLETLPTAMLVALTLGLWQMQRPASAAGKAGIATALLAVAALQSFVRADVACLLNLGIFAMTLTPLGKRLSLPRALAAFLTLVSALLATGVQFYLARVVFPQATYGRVKMWQLRPNLIHGTRWVPFALFMLPLAWMLVQVVRRRFSRDAASIALLAGAIAYVALWATIGKIDEVRIFAPFALALAPLTVEMLMLRASDANNSTG